MKRRIALLLACLLTVSFMGACSKEVADEGSGAPVKDETPVAIEPAEEEEVEEVATAPTYALTSVTADDYTYFTGGVQCIQITDDKHPELSAAIDAQFSDLVSSFNKSAESMNKEAEEMNAENKKYAEENPDIEYYETSYSDDITVEIIRADAKVFSFVIYDYNYTGGAHGMTDETGYTYDSSTGKLLELSDLGDETKIKDTAVAYILNSIDSSDQSAKDLLFTADDFSDNGYEENVKACFEGDLIPAFYLDERGLVFVFQQYSIAPYAAGIITFTVPYEAFEGLNQEYIQGEGFYCASLSSNGFVDKVDVNDDGALENVSVYSVINESTSMYDLTLSVGTDTVVIESLEYSNIGYPVYYVHGTDGNYIIYDSSEQIYVYEVSKGLKLVGQIEAESVKEITDGEITVGTRNYGDNENPWSDVVKYSYSKSEIKQM